MKVIVTIPAFNEEKTIGKVISEIKQEMRKSSYLYSILVLDDGSKDNTVDVAKTAGATVVSNPRNLGLARTFQREIEECLKRKADVIVHTDADGQYPSRYIPQLIDKVVQGYDLVLGSRFITRSYSGSLMKNIGNRLFSHTISSLTGIRITDSTTGFRAFTKEVAKDITFINTFTYTQEQLIRAAKQKFRIAEIPIHTRKTRDSRLFNNSFQYAYRAWINIIRIYRDYNPLRFFGSIGISLLFIGSLIAAYFIYLHFTSGITGHLGLLFAMILFIVSGLQIVLFGFLADMNKK